MSFVIFEMTYVMAISCLMTGKMERLAVILYQLQLRRLITMKYMSNMKQKLANIVDSGKIRTAAAIGLVGIAATLSGCASIGGGSFTLAKTEWGHKTVFTNDEQTKQQVIDADAKYQNTVDVCPGQVIYTPVKGSFGPVYKN